MRTATEKQYGTLRMLGNGCAWIVGNKREVEPFLRRGWVTAEPPTDDKRYYSWIRITPDGLRALAAAVEKYGLPDLTPKAETHRRVCAKCGSGQYRYERVTAEELAV